MTITGPAFLESLREHRLLEDDQLSRLGEETRTYQPDAASLAEDLCRRGALTGFQVDLVLRGQAADLVLGQYVLTDRLGEGGMGAVFKAYHRITRGVRAVKLIRPDCLTSRHAVERFFREAEVYERLNHPNIIRFYDAGRDGDRCYFVMEYAPGCDLAKLVKERGPLPIAEACDYVRQAALGLQHAHERGLVHRDIKPSNLLLVTEERVVKVLDLGLARLREAPAEADEAAPLTPQGVMMGTPDFMAPEQAEDSSTVDIRADIYSLGCTLYQLLSGSLPFPGGSLADKLRRHYSEMPVPLSQRRANIPPALEAVVAKMMAKRAEQRYQTPADVARACASFCGVPGAASLSTPETRGLDTRPPESAAGDSQTPFFPQTMEMPAGVAASGATPTTGMMPTVPPSDFWQTDDATEQMKPARSTAPPPARPGRRLWLVATLVLLGTGVAAAVFLGRDRLRSGPVADAGPKEPGQPNDRSPEKRPGPKAHPADRPPQQVKGADGIKPPDRPNPVQPVKEKEKEGKARGLPRNEGEVPAARAKPGRGGTHAGKPRLWQRAEVVHTLGEVVVQATFAAGGSRAAVRTSSHVILLYDPARKTKPEVVSPYRLLFNWLGPKPVLGRVALPPDGGRVLFATVVAPVEDIKGLPRRLASYDALVEYDFNKSTYFFGDIASVQGGELSPEARALAYTGDGRKIVVGTSRQFRRWDLDAREVYHVKPAAVNNIGGQVESVACSPDGRHAAAGTRESTVHVFRLEAGRNAAAGELRGHGGTVYSVAFVGNEHLVSGDSGGAVSLWRVPVRARTKASPLSRADWHEGPVLCAAGLASGGSFITGGADGEVCLGKVGVSKPVWRQKCGGRVLAVSFSADGRYVLYATDTALGRIPVQPLAEAEARPGNK